MAGLVESLLLLLPLITWLVWRQIAPPDWQPSRALLVGLVLAILLLAAFGLWTRESRIGAPDAVYVPPRLGPDGEVEPSHLVPAR